MQVCVSLMEWNSVQTTKIFKGCCGVCEVVHLLNIVEDIASLLLPSYHMNTHTHTQRDFIKKMDCVEIPNFKEKLRRKTMSWETGLDTSSSSNLVKQNIDFEVHT